jgi:type IV pilus assembly protein PilF
MPDPLLALASLQHEAGNDMQARAFVQRYHEAAPATAQSVWLGYLIETGAGDAAAAEEYARRLRMEFPTSAETGLLFERERGSR